MKERIKDDSIRSCDKLAVDTKGLQALLDCGRDTAIKIGIEAGAKIKHGNRTIWNVKKVQRYLDIMAE